MGDKWLADHFYSASLVTAASVENDGGKTAAEGHCNVALALEESGRFSFWLVWILQSESDKKQIISVRIFHILNISIAGEHYDAAENFERFYSLCKDKPDFNMDDGREMHPLACNHLCRIYTTIAKQYESNGNLNQYLSYLQKAYDHAKEG